MVTPIVKQLSAFVALQKENITNQVVVVFKDILRKHPLQYKEILNTLNQILENINEDESKIALIWILGEYSDKYDMSPYLIENYIQAIEENQEQIQIKHSVLSAAVKCFYHRPLETQAMLARLINKIMSDSNSDIDLQERCFYYYNVLRTNPNDLRKIFSSSNSILQFLEEEKKEKEKDGIELNSLSVIYGKSKDKFIKEWEYFK